MGVGAGVQSGQAGGERSTTSQQEDVTCTSDDVEVLTNALLRQLVLPEAPPAAGSTGAGAALAGLDASALLAYAQACVGGSAAAPVAPATSTGHAAVSVPPPAPPTDQGGCGGGDGGLSDTLSLLSSLDANTLNTLILLAGNLNAMAAPPAVPAAPAPTRAASHSGHYKSAADAATNADASSSVNMEILTALVQLLGAQQQPLLPQQQQQQQQPVLGALSRPPSSNALQGAGAGHGVQSRSQPASDSPHSLADSDNSSAQSCLTQASRSQPRGAGELCTMQRMYALAAGNTAPPEPQPASDYTSVEHLHQKLLEVHRRGGCVVEEALRFLPKLDSQAFAALLKVMGKEEGEARGQPNELANKAFELFDAVVKASQEHFDWRKANPLLAKSNLELLLDTYSYTTIISLSTGSRENCRRGLHYFAQMRGRDIEPNTYTYTALMSICLKVNECDTAVDIYKDMVSSGNKPSSVTNKIVLDAFGRAGRWDEAWQVFEHMEERGAKLDARLYTLVFMALARVRHAFTPAQAAQRATELVRRMVEQDRVQPTIPVYLNLIKVYGRVGQIENALSFFNAIPAHERPGAAYANLAEAYDAIGNEQYSAWIRAQAPATMPLQRSSSKSGMCTAWDGRDCFFMNLHGSCKYSHTHRPGISNRPRS